MVEKKCFMNAERPCDLTCKAAFEVDDPTDPVDCYFIWLAHPLGEGLFTLRDNLAGPGSSGPPGFGGGFPGGPGPTATKEPGIN